MKLEKIAIESRTISPDAITPATPDQIDKFAKVQRDLEIQPTNPIDSATISVNRASPSITDLMPTAMKAAQAVSDDLRVNKAELFKTLKNSDPLDPMSQLKIAGASVQLDNAKIQFTMLTSFVDGIKNSVNALTKMQ